MSKLYMFTTSHCTKCPEVKKALSKKDIEVEYIDAEEIEALHMKYNELTKWNKKECE